MILCSLTFTPPSSKLQPSSASSIASSTSEADSFLEKFIYVPNWRNPKFVIWAVVLPCALFGYFVPFIHLVQYAQAMVLDEDPDLNTSKASFLLACLSITSGKSLKSVALQFLSLVEGAKPTEMQGEGVSSLIGFLKTTALYFKQFATC